MRTRVGYAGGTTNSPNYYDLGDHSETVQIDYDPTRISFEDLLNVFWNSHSPTTPSYSRQYMSIIFYHNEEQEKLAIESKHREEVKLGRKISTEIMPISKFYLAEEYHQKYYLRQVPELMAELTAIYPDIESFIASTAVTRLNGYAGGYGNLATLKSQLNSFGLSEAGKARLFEITQNSLMTVCPLS